MTDQSQRRSSRSKGRSKSKKPAGARAAVVGAVVLVIALMAALPVLRDRLHPTVVASQASVTATVAPTAEAAPNSSSPAVSAPIADRAADEELADRDQDEIRDVKAIAELPIEESAVMAAHDAAAKYRCEFIPPGEPLEFQGYHPYLLPQDSHRLEGHVTSLATRRHAFSVGLGVLNVDRDKLPVVSKQQILNYLDAWQISFQVRIQKDPITEALYLSHRPLACLVGYGNATVTGEPTEGLIDSLKNYRSLGLFLPEGEESTPKNLRTLVILHRGERAEDEDAVDRQAVYEYVFVRARENRGGELELHPFGTSGGRTKIHYLRPAEKPAQSDDCSLKTWICFTSYTHGGLLPETSVSRTTTVNARSTFPVEALEQYAKSQKWEGGAWANLPRVLDAIIDGRVPLADASGATAPSSALPD